jgi:hypothetical protein
MATANGIDLRMVHPRIAETDRTAWLRISSRKTAVATLHMPAFRPNTRPPKSLHLT